MEKGRLRYYINRKQYYKVDNILIMLLSLIIVGVYISTILSKDTVTLEVTANQNTVKLVEQQDEVIEEEVEEIVEEVKEPKNTSMKYRMTYYYTGDGTNSSSITASGKTTSDFSTNSRGWYTYKGKLVVATASTRLSNWSQYKGSTQKKYKLYDELVLTIEGIKYDAIVLDVCGACMKSEKIDLFVKDRASGLDTTIYVDMVRD